MTQSHNKKNSFHSLRALRIAFLLALVVSVVSLTFSQTSLARAVRGESSSQRQLPIAATQIDTTADTRADTSAPDKVSLEQAVAQVQAKYKARALKFSTIEEDGKRVHYIRLMSADHARVWTVRIDAATGREL